MLSALGLVDGPLQWLRTFPALVAVLTYEHIPFAVLILVSSLQAIPLDKINAARLLGASVPRIVFASILPLTMPGLVASAILVFSLSASSYLAPILIAAQRIRVLPLMIFSYGTELLNWPLAAALAIRPARRRGRHHLRVLGSHEPAVQARPVGDGVICSGSAIFVYLIVVLMLLPVLITFPVALTAVSRISFPPVGLSARWFLAILGDHALLDAIVRSFWLAIAAAHRRHRDRAAVRLRRRSAAAFRGRNLLETWITSPRMIPQIVLALALLAYFESIGLAESFLGLVIAHLVITIPFAFRTLLVSVATMDRRLEWSSDVLGATPTQTFIRVMVPQLKTGLIAAFIFAFILSFNNVTLALFLSGFGQRTLPVEMFQRMNVAGMTPVIPAISFVLALVGVVLFVILDRTVGVYRFLAGRD